MWLLIHLVDQPLEMDDSVGQTNGQVPAPAVSRTSAAPLFQLAAFQAQNPIKGPQVCLVARRRRRMLDGDLSIDSVRQSLTVAIATLESRRATATGADAAQLADAIDTLAQMKESTGEWEIEG
jgi:hypothetical protein